MMQLTRHNNLEFLSKYSVFEHSTRRKKINESSKCDVAQNHRNGDASPEQGSEKLVFLFYFFLLFHLRTATHFNSTKNDRRKPDNGLVQLVLNLLTYMNVCSLTRSSTTERLYHNGQHAACETRIKCPSRDFA